MSSWVTRFEFCVKLREKPKGVFYEKTALLRGPMKAFSLVLKARKLANCITKVNSGLALRENPLDSHPFLHYFILSTDGKPLSSLELGEAGPPSPPESETKHIE